MYGLYSTVPVKYGTVRGSFPGAGGGVSFTFTPSVSVIRYAQAGGFRVTPEPVVCGVDASGNLVDEQGNDFIKLLASGIGFIPSEWHWTVTSNLSGWRPYAFVLSPGEEVVLRAPAGTSEGTSHSSGSFEPDVKALQREVNATKRLLNDFMNHSVLSVRLADLERDYLPAPDEGLQVAMRVGDVLLVNNSDGGFSGRALRRVERVYDTNKTLLVTTPFLVSSVATFSADYSTARLVRVDDGVRAELSHALPQMTPVYVEFQDYSGFTDDVLEVALSEVTKVATLPNGWVRARALAKYENSQYPDALVLWSDVIGVISVSLHRGQTVYAPDAVKQWAVAQTVDDRTAYVEFTLHPEYALDQVSGMSVGVFALMDNSPLPVSIATGVVEEAVNNRFRVRVGTLTGGELVEAWSGGRVTKAVGGQEWNITGLEDGGDNIVVLTVDAPVSSDPELSYPPVFQVNDTINFN